MRIPSFDSILINVVYLSESATRLVSHCFQGEIVLSKSQTCLFQSTIVSLTLNQMAVAETIKMAGAIDSKYAITATLNCIGAKCDGTYQYTKVGKPIALRGSLSPAGVLSLTESGADGKPTGAFTGKMVQNKRFVGTWTNPKKDRSMPFLLANMNDSAALSNGLDGIIVSRATTSAVKKGGATDKATVAYPKVTQTPWGDPGLNAKVNAAISLKTVLKQSPEEFIEEVKSGNHWLNSIDYVVNYNKNNLLDIDFTMEGCGAYPSASVEHVLVDTSKGKSVSPSEAFTPEGVVSLKKILEKEMKEEMASTIKENKKNAEAEEMLAGIFGSAPTITTKDLLPFSVSDTGLTFICDWGFPHVALALEPDGKYFFPFSALKPFIKKTGPLGVFVK